MKAVKHLKHMMQIARMMLIVAGLAGGLSSAQAASEGVSQVLEESVQIDGQRLNLNGSGTHIIKRVKIFNIGLYTTKPRNNTADLLASPGPVRLKLVMVKEVESELMGRRFLADIRSSTTKEERNQLVYQLMAMGEGFAKMGDWKVGDVMTIDWSQGKGTVFRSNNRQIGETLKDDLTMHAILKIWLGDNVADNKLKRLLLGDKE
ncbi:chalcone isomerase family protein [Undibacterium sp. WLHG33]|uniref:chalcone isomerase family protein n=1 Tax=Undibacterium sp. WLHG33 TaxID=3412482 RepID=UPI003C2CE49A